MDLRIFFFAARKRFAMGEGGWIYVRKASGKQRPKGLEPGAYLRMERELLTARRGVSGVEV